MPRSSSTSSVSSSTSEGTKRKRPRHGVVWKDQEQSAVMPARLVLIGAKRVGTTALLKRFIFGLYSETYKPEKNFLMVHKKSVFHDKSGNYVTLEFWDIEGDDINTAMKSAHKAHAVAVVYDITNRSSFEIAQKYLEGVNPRASALLVGTRLDHEEYRKVSYKEGRLLAKIHRVSFIETSAKDNLNVDEAFQKLISSIPQEYIVGKDGHKGEPSKKQQQNKMMDSTDSLSSARKAPYTDSTDSLSSARKAPHRDTVTFQEEEYMMKEQEPIIIRTNPIRSKSHERIPSDSGSSICDVCSQSFKIDQENMSRRQVLGPKYVNRECVRF